MTIIKAQLVGKQALISRSELDQLVALARRSESVELQVLEDEIPTRDLMRLADTGKAFDFWKEDGENIYSPLDVSPCASKPARKLRFKTSQCLGV